MIPRSSSARPGTDQGRGGGAPAGAAGRADATPSASGIAWFGGSIRRAIGPVDLLVRDPAGLAVAVEIKRRGEIDGVEQLTRYLELLNRDPLLAPVRGVFAAQEIKPQARTLARDRGIECLVLDYDALRGVDDVSQRLF